MTPLTARRGGPLQGRVRVPGDKSISHRALILGALTVGETTVSGLLEGEDVLRTAEAMRALGATVERGADGVWRIHGVGVGGFAAPAQPLDFGNSGTGCRLVIGAVAGCPITATFDGDASLRKRPMRRVLDPLEKMGARATEAAEGGRLPLTLTGARDPIPITYESPVPSAQLKSAVLLAGARRAGRDHRDRGGSDARPHRTHAQAFRRQGQRQADGEHGRRVTLNGQPELEPAAVVGAGRSVLGGVSDGRRADRAGLGRDPRSGDDQPAAHRAAHDPARDGRRHRGAGDAAPTAARRSPTCACAPAASRASTCRRSARRR